MPAKPEHALLIGNPTMFCQPPLEMALEKTAALRFDVVGLWQPQIEECRVAAFCRAISATYVWVCGIATCRLCEVSVRVSGTCAWPIATSRLHFAPGMGCLDLDGILSALRETGFHGTAMLDLWSYPFPEEGARIGVP